MRMYDVAPLSVQEKGEKLPKGAGELGAGAGDVEP